MHPPCYPLIFFVVSGYECLGSLKQEVVQQKHLVRKLAKSILRGKSASVKAMLDSKRLGGGMLAWQAVTDYLSSRSDGSLKPFLLQGIVNSGTSYTYTQTTYFQVDMDLAFQRLLLPSMNVASMRFARSQATMPL